MHQVYLILGPSSPSPGCSLRSGLVTPIWSTPATHTTETAPAPPGLAVPSVDAALDRVAVRSGNVMSLVTLGAPDHVKDHLLVVTHTPLQLPGVVPQDSRLGGRGFRLGCRERFPEAAATRSVEGWSMRG